jgi:hypothetical protein
MSILNQQQPLPTPNGRRASWDLVIAEIEIEWEAHRDDRLMELLIADMRERDLLGTKKYGVRLQSHNGRDALIDAYQEALDLVVYLRNARDECEPYSTDWQDVKIAFFGAVNIAADLRRQIRRRRGV